MSSKAQKLNKEESQYMSYDSSKDKTVVSDVYPVSEIERLEVSVVTYDDKSPKLQIGPRSVEQKDGETKHRKAGRLSRDETQWLFQLLEDWIPEYLDK